jgi:hypothetical protein
MSCSDLIHLLRITGEKSIEWGETVWMASLDLEKAFDKVIHATVFEGLERSRIDPATISAIKDLYSHQNAFIDLGTGARSRFFQILRGVRQGDPLSPALFLNSVRASMTTLKAKWERSKLGSIIGANCLDKNRISFAMFADDTTLIARSKRSLEKMLEDVHEELTSIGLNLNADKCSIQCSTARACHTRSLKVHGQDFPVVSPDAGFKVLGTIFTLDGNTSVELEHRLNAAWGKFHELWPLLRKRGTCLQRRLRLFQATVSQTALWCAQSWTLT